ncbi:MAG: preprotein translocase subunit Sec61beta [Caldisphaera sp.]|jgi:preprotein translocase subunit Sec61beta|uniref:preprotein translocase subunit Sec61beta n=1 Tax=Caldisphaera sp. TaxID=2060322 RepID=UPI000CBDCDD7|nr:preprotein translocase subunit Sec61beta [Caldisphaera sp.]PMP59672.1 MAG: preprotein translocase subunit Sec61beta [Caldisphaera sp.]
MSTKPKKRSSKKKQTSPMTSAGLIAFYEDYDSKIEISPMTLIIISVAIAIIVIFARLI